MGARGFKSKYADRTGEEEFAPVVHSISKLDDPRRHDPKNPGSAGTGVKLSLFSDFATGDWSWKPFRDRALGYGNESAFRTFRGVPPSAAELYRGAMQQPG